MANLKEVRIRIASVNTTQQITKAMKLVAASKLKRAQDRILQMRPYSEKLNEMLSNIMSGMEGGSSLSFNKQREVKNVLIVLITSDKDDLLYYRGTQKIEINNEEFFPDNYESKLLMSGINVAPKQRYYDIGNVSPGNGIIKLSYTDAEDGRTAFTPYRVSLYVDCEMEDEL